MKQFTLPDILTQDEIKQAARLKKADLICKEIIEPNIERINEALGQENDPLYLAYACEYALQSTSKKD